MLFRNNACALIMVIVLHSGSIMHAIEIEQEKRFPITPEQLASLGQAVHDLSALQKETAPFISAVNPAAGAILNDSAIVEDKIAQQINTIASAASLVQGHPVIIAPVQNNTPIQQEASVLSSLFSWKAPILIGIVLAAGWWVYNHHAQPEEEVDVAVIVNEQV